MSRPRGRPRKPRRLAEGRQLGEVDLYDGREQGRLVCEADPDGAVVVHAYRLDHSPLARLLKAGTIGQDLWQAGQQFQADFEVAQLQGRYVTVSYLGRAGGGAGDLPSPCLDARRRVRSALQALGLAEPAQATLQAQVVWHVLGCGDTLGDAARRLRWSGGAISEHKVAGIFVSALERLALHYGITSQGAIKRSEYDRGLRDGLARAADLVEAAARAATGGAVEAVRANLARVAASLRRSLEHLRERR